MTSGEGGGWATPPRQRRRFNMSQGRGQGSPHTILWAKFKKFMPVEMPKSRTLIEVLKSTQRRYGCIYPVLIARLRSTGEEFVIDGNHRLAADPNWPRITIEVDSIEDIIALKFITNAVRRYMPPEEKRGLINTLADMLIAKGVRREELMEKLEEFLKIPRRTIYFYLDEKFKLRTKPRKRIATLQSPPPPSPYRQVILFLDEQTANALEKLMVEKKFGSLNDTCKWLIHEALKIFTTTRG
jgi:hypothetical protein